MKLEEIIEKEWTIGVNAIIISECFHILSRFIGGEEAWKRISKFLDSSSVLYLTIEKMTMHKAMRLAIDRAQRRINDMIILQHALDSKADALLTDNLKHFEGISDVEILSLR